MANGPGAGLAEALQQSTTSWALIGLAFWIVHTQSATTLDYQQEQIRVAQEVASAVSAKRDKDLEWTRSLLIEALREGDLKGSSLDATTERFFESQDGMQRTLEDLQELLLRRNTSDPDADPHPMSGGSGSRGDSGGLERAFAVAPSALRPD